MWKLILFTLISAYAISQALIFIYYADWGRHVFNHKPGYCQLVSGVEHGSEDGQMVEEGLAIVSSGLRTLDGSYSPQFANVTGQLLLFDFNSKSATPMKITGGSLNLKQFNPHGLSVWNDHTTGLTLLYVVNHPDLHVHVVEKFKVIIEEKKLVHMATIRDDQFVVINDLVVTEEDEFYVTNFRYSFSQWLLMIETYWRSPWGSVLYYHKGKTSFAITGYIKPNGINVSPDQKKLYVCVGGSKEIHEYDIVHKGVLRFSKALALHTSVDNVDVDAGTGDLWIGAHPISWKIRAHLSDTSLPSPSQVLQIRVVQGKLSDVYEVYSDAGLELSGSSFALHYNKQILVGTVHHKLLHCQLNHDY